jgi:hypothetical protein
MTILQNLVASYATTWASMTPPQSFTMSDDSVEKRSEAPILPLCPEHHRGATGVHGLGAKGFERYHEVEFDTLLGIVKALDGYKTKLGSHRFSPIPTKLLSW